MPKEDWDDIRPVRMSDELWEEAGRAASDQGTDRSALIREFLKQYVEKWKNREDQA